MRNESEFLMDLATVLEKHRVAICTRTIDAPPLTCSEVFFQHRGPGAQIESVETGRGHVSAYDLRCEAGLSCADANTLYTIHRSLQDKP